MTRRDAKVIGWSVFTVATGAMYAAVAFFGIPLLRYYPLEHVWRWGSQPGAPSQGWYAHQVLALAAGAVCGVIAYALCGRVFGGDRPRSPAFWRAYGLAATAALLASMAYILYHEFHKWGILA